MAAFRLSKSAKRVFFASAFLFELNLFRPSLRDISLYNRFVAFGLNL